MDRDSNILEKQVNKVSEIQMFYFYYVFCFPLNLEPWLYFLFREFRIKKSGIV